MSNGKTVAENSGGSPKRDAASPPLGTDLRELKRGAGTEARADAHSGIVRNSRKGGEPNARQLLRLNECGSSGRRNVIQL